jgi:hypothetical protein
VNSASDRIQSRSRLFLLPAYEAAFRLNVLLARNKRLAILRKILYGKKKK